MIQFLKNKYQEIGKEKIIKGLERLFVGFSLLTILIACLCGCSPQKQLARLLAQHPELHTDSIYKIDTFYIQPADSSTITFTIDDLRHLVDTAADLDSVNIISKGNSPLYLSTATQSSSATVTANADGSFSLNLKQKPDTIHITDSIKIPVYITDTQTEYITIYQQTKWQKFCYNLGLTLFIMVILFIILFIILRILKYYKIIH